MGVTPRVSPLRALRSVLLVRLVCAVAVVAVAEQEIPAISSEAHPWSCLLTVTI